MSIDEFDDMLPQSISVEPFTGIDGYGRSSYGTSVVYGARVVGKTRMVRDGAGREQVSSHTVYVQSRVDFSTKDRITLPSEYIPQQPLIVAVGTFPDEDGIHHKTLYLA